MLQAIRSNMLYSEKDGFRCYENAYLVLEDGVIRGIFENDLPEKYANAKIDNYGDSLLVPSFCDLHLHAPQYAMLGMGMDLQLIDWLNKYTFEIEAMFADKDYARTVYRQLAQDLISHGTTRVSMFSSLHTDATLILMEELERAGVCGYVGKVNMDRNGGRHLQETTEESIRETLRFLDSCKDFKLLKPIITPRFTPSCTNELMEALGKIANERGLRVQSHLSENPDEIAWVKELHPDCAHYWETYAKYGMWKADTLMAHCVHVDESERESMKKAGVYLIHCPSSNMNIRSGNAPIVRALNEGVKVALGSDISGGTTLDMLRCIVDAIHVSKVRWVETKGEDDFLRFYQGFDLATGAGAVWFGAKPGFPVGEKLHAVVLSDERFCPTRPLSLPERLERISYVSDPRNIVAVYSEGIRRF